MSPATWKSDELIAGYVLKERIGAGGYGEVWRAEAPGGLAKAVKFVYGFLDDQRAAAEMKALSRIKEVRHPFLLSLERIEVIDGQLVIVTELADWSLKDRYEECRTSGVGGIPRDELLQYLGDAADALDYMSQRYSLQHLDIKPENLLVVGGRVKVADFGLVKDIHGATVSMPSGLTPVYAAPEVFDGQPCLHSDQYSLAIVYQEMLTGTLPFPGRTPAQLAAQHLNSRPRLGMLPPADREVIARALAKNPDERFPSCRALVDRLMAARPSSTEVIAQVPSLLAGLESVVPTTSTTSHLTLSGPEPSGRPEEAPQAAELTLVQTARQAGDAQSPAAAEEAVLEVPEVVAEIRELPPIDVTPDDYRLRPTLFIGIGGTAGRAFRRLRRRLNDRFEDLSSIPSLQFLLLDTDVKGLAQASQAGQPGALKPHETVALPLRRCHDYREDSEKLLHWLSRRWLYNIPRSLQTEGLRPLGRLAFVDRAEQAIGRLRSAVASIMTPEALAASRQNAGLEVRDDFPRVFLVASISGGTGSGMVLDVAYAVRKILAELGLSQEGLCGILVHSSGRHPAQRDLAAANAYSCLSELSHYNRTRRYPGDPDSLLPAMEGERPFADAYLVHLGDDLDEEQFDAATDGLAEYLYLDAVTGAGAFLDKCRQETRRRANPSGVSKVRTFSVCQIGCSQSELPAAATEYLCRQVVERWCGDGERFDELGRLASQRAAQMELSVDRLIELAYQSVQTRLGDDADGVAHDLIQPLFDPAQRTTLATYLEDLAAGQAKTIGDFIEQLIDDPHVRVRGAQHVAQWFVEHFRSFETETVQRLRQAEQSLAGAAQKAAAKKGGRRGAAELGENAASALLTAEEDSPEISPLRLRQIVLEGVLRFGRSVGRQVAATAARLGELKRELSCLAEEFDAPDSLTEAADGRPLPARGVPPSIIEPLQAQFPEMIRQLEEQLQESCLAPHGGLSALLKRDSKARLALLARMRSLARSAVLHALKQINITNFFPPADKNPEPNRNGLTTCLKGSAPRLLACGGARRLLVVLPENANGAGVRQAVQRQVQEQPTVVFDPDGDIVICQEAEDLSLRAVAAQLAAQREQIPLLASRLHTRIDVSWAPIA